MKHLNISILILSVISLNFVTALAETENENARLSSKEKELTQGKRSVRKRHMDPNKISDPNQAKTQISESEKMRRKLLVISKGSKKEEQEWMNRRAANRIALAKAVQKQVVAELSFLLELAVKEEAKKTIQAIDQLLASREKRFEKLITKMQAEQKSKSMETRKGRKNQRQDRDSRRSNK